MRYFYGGLIIYCWVHLVFLSIIFINETTPIRGMAVLAWSFALGMSVYRYRKHELIHRRKEIGKARKEHGVA